MVQRTLDADGREMLYILNFYLPRFLNLSFEDKLSTVVHELWHISPHFNGDIRRFAGRCFAHGESQREYEAVVAALAKRWMAMNPPKFTYEFLRFDYRALVRRHGRVHGTKVRTPRLIPAAQPAPSASAKDKNYQALRDVRPTDRTRRAKSRS